MVTLKEFNKNLRYLYPLAVVKSVYDKVQNGQNFEQALHEVAKLYAHRLSTQELHYDGYCAVSHEAGITVYKIKTVTKGGLHRLSPSILEDDYSLAMTMFGENFYRDVMAVFYQQPDSILGCYVYRNLYVAVVRLGYNKETMLPDELLKKLHIVADILAKNALAYYPAYIVACNKENFYQQHKIEHSPVSEWKSFLFAQTLRFVEHINVGYETSSSFYASNTWITIGNYLQGFAQQTELDIHLESVDFYGL